jgi:hypothetical protein
MAYKARFGVEVPKGNEAWAFRYVSKKAAGMRSESFVSGEIA